MRGNGGLIIFIGALGMMATLMAGDISELRSWDDLKTPLFVGGALAHFGAVIAAYVGGQLTERSR
jgi:hypothetical protein